MPGVTGESSQVAQRIRAVQEWILQGQAQPDIVKQGVQAWNVSDVQVRKYIAAAKKKFNEWSDQDCKATLKLNIERRMKLFRDLKDKNTAVGAKAANDILNSIDDLNGSFKRKHELTGKDGVPLESSNVSTVIIIPSNGRES